MRRRTTQTRRKTTQRALLKKKNLFFRTLETYLDHVAPHEVSDECHVQDRKRKEDETQNQPELASPCKMDSTVWDERTYEKGPFVIVHGGSQTRFCRGRRSELRRRPQTLRVLKAEFTPDAQYKTDTKERIQTRHPSIRTPAVLGSAGSTLGRPSCAIAYSALHGSQFESLPSRPKFRSLYFDTSIPLQGITSRKLYTVLLGVTWFSTTSSAIIK